MKKIITIALLVVTILAGGMTMEAKTTKKKGNSKARTSQTSSNIDDLLDQYDLAVDMLFPFYNEESGSIYGWGSEFIKFCNREETLYKKLKKLENSMTSEQKSKFKKLSHLYNQR